jgi:riboflavin synthase
MDITQNTFTVSLIPLTQQWTNLGTAKLGETINIEYDMIAKFVAKMVSPIHTS